MNAASERGIAKRRARQAADSVTDKVVITTLMSTVEGRRWIWLQLEFYRVFAATENLDSLALAFEAGRRNCGLRLLKSTQGHAPQMYVRMLEENSGVKLTQEQEQDNDGHSDDDQ